LLEEDCSHWLLQEKERNLVPSKLLLRGTKPCPILRGVDIDCALRKIDLHSIVRPSGQEHFGALLVAKRKQLFEARSRKERRDPKRAGISGCDHRFLGFVVPCDELTNQSRVHVGLVASQDDERVAIRKRSYPGADRDPDAAFPKIVWHECDWEIMQCGYDWFSLSPDHHHDRRAIGAEGGARGAPDEAFALKSQQLLGLT
jgi:hypothetical protein